MDIIASRRHFEVTNNDVVMYNRHCYQLMTKYYRDYSGRYHLPCDMTPIIPNKRAEKWIKDGILKFYKNKTDAFGIKVTYYKFNVEGAEK